MNQTNSSAVTADKHPKMISVEQALEFLLEHARRIDEQEILPLGQALGRVVAAPQHSAIDVPGFDNSAMDGIALRAADAVTDTVCLPVSQRITAGDTPSPLAPGEAARIFTGAPLPAGADAVVMQENCAFDNNTVRFHGPVRCGQHVRPRGNNIGRGAEILSAGTRIRPQELGIAASVGLHELPVCRRVKVACFSSGDELVEPGTRLESGQIYNSNRYTLRGLIEALGCEVIDLGIVEDDLDATKRFLLDAAERADVVVSSGGVSVGEEDHIKNAIVSVGRLEMWNIAIKPGKPVAYGRIGKADFLGLPGNPVSTLVTFCLLVRPFLLAREGATEVAPRRFPVAAGFEWPQPKGRREFARARLELSHDGELRAHLYPKQGSDVLSSTVWASGLVEIPEQTTVAKGDRVQYIGFEQVLG